MPDIGTIVMALGMAYIVMAYIVLAYIVMACVCLFSKDLAGVMYRHRPHHMHRVVVLYNKHEPIY